MHRQLLCSVSIFLEQWCGKVSLPKAGEESDNQFALAFWPLRYLLPNQQSISRDGNKLLKNMIEDKSTQWEACICHAL